MFLRQLGLIANGLFARLSNMAKPPSSLLAAQKVSSCAAVPHDAYFLAFRIS